ncbi:helicase-related protein [Lyngbya sp. CCY1209]|uniref:helicase-related protein n=1 Tax=Lyngbya sp. CCY1209 TaxID=2886103 RepID=UPI002D200EC8|nr:helicase-related protein [Lyngbya sp. CCY1209]MEB3884064.1 phospholipase D-like domain-containing protein [Lyngbya sp. CCY1209]
MSEPKTSRKRRSSWFEPGKSLEYITSGLEKAKSQIRIATGFFTIKGWNLIRRYTKEKQTYLLVGLDEPGEKRAREALVKEIMRDLRTGLDRDRRQAVIDLVQKIESDRFEIVDARATDHHNKLYICDGRAAIQTSSNLTGKGLMQQVEGGNVITNFAEVAALVREFDEYFAGAQDLTRELLDILRKWLQFASPWDIYLKTMLAFEDVQPPQTRYAKKPVSYQVNMIAQTLRHLREFRGSMLVASTGLGKTVVAVHVALHLKEEDAIDNVCVVGPKAVRPNWEKEMRMASLPCTYFVRQMFDATNAKKDSNLNDFEDILEESKQQRWLLVIDESHELRNRFKQDLFSRTKNPPERLAFVRLRKFVETGDLRVLLLTGSPYAKEIEDINNQLHLLPHTASTRSDGVYYFLEKCPESQHLFDSETRTRNAWAVKNTDDFIKLSVVSQLTTPHVAKYYGIRDECGTYIEFGDNKGYVPEVILHTVNFPLVLADNLTEAISAGYFQVNTKSPIHKHFFERLVKVAWASSALALRGVLECIVDTPGGANSYDLKKMSFKFPRRDREECLSPIIEELKKIGGDREDIKVVTLSRIVKAKIDAGEKIIIFCERRATVYYLYNQFQVLLPKSKIAATIEKVEEGKYETKDSRDVEKLIRDFAPVANGRVQNYPDSDLTNYDIFISTDAYGVGVNMQDASVVVNYDIDWTPIGPIQRAGRVLRFWHSPRTINIYTFVPTLPKTHKNSPFNYDLIEIQKRWDNLMSRHRESRKLTDLPVLTTEVTQLVDMAEMASESVTVESAKMNLDALASLDISPYYRHTAQLQLNRDYAKSLRDDLVSAKTYPGKKPLLYLLLLHDGKYRGLFYEPDTGRVTEPEIVATFNEIACEAETPTANVDYEWVETMGDRCVKRWCDDNRVPSDEVERICTLYLKPEGDDGDLSALLSKPE